MFFNYASRSLSTFSYELSRSSWVDLSRSLSYYTFLLKLLSKSEIPLAADYFWALSSSSCFSFCSKIALEWSLINLFVFSF